MDYIKFDEELKKLAGIYQKLFEDVECSVEACAKEDEVCELEKTLDLKLPQPLRQFLLNYSSHLNLSVFLSDDFCEELPEELDEIFSACFELSLEEIERAETSRRDWVENCFSDEEEEYDRIWHNKLGIMTVANGDVIALDIKQDKENPPVVYVSHDDGEGHGAVLGKDFDTFLMNLVKIGGCGNEDWQMLPFITDPVSGIDPDCENAGKYRELIGFELYIGK